MTILIDPLILSITALLVVIIGGVNQYRLRRTIKTLLPVAAEKRIVGPWEYPHIDEDAHIDCGDK